MFVNISTIPSYKWEEKKIKEAEKYGDIVDFEFPKLTSDTERIEIAQIALKLCNQVLMHIAMFNNQEHVVHVYGEPTLCLTLISMLKNQGVECLTTIIKEVAEEGDCEKVPKSNFVKFQKA